MRCITGTNGAIGIDDDFKMKPVLDQDNAAWCIGFAGITDKLVMIAKACMAITHCHYKRSIDNGKTGYIIPAALCQRC